MTLNSWKSDGRTSLAQLAGEKQAAVSTILRVTAERGKYDAPFATYLDAVFSGKLPVSAPIPAGSLLWVPVTA